MKKLRYDPKSIRSGLTLVTLLCWILPIIIIVTMFSVLVNYYNDRNLEQAMELGMENAMHQVELRLLSVIEDSKAVSYDGIVRQSYSEASGLVYKDVTEYLTQKFTRNANYRCVFISSASGDEPVHAYAAAPGTAKLNLLRYYRDSVYPEVRALLESMDTGIYFLTVDEEIYMVRNLLDHDFTPYAMLVLGLEKSEAFQSLYGIANMSITGVRIDGVELPVAAAEAHDAGGGLCLRAYAKKDGRLFFEVEHDGEMTPDGWARIQDALQSPAAPAFVSQLTSDAVIEQFVTTEMTALAAPVVPTGGNSLYQSAAQMNAAVTKYVGAVQDALSGEAMIRSARPDIVFTDIRMPDQDGLTMLAGLKSEFPDMQIAVLTGYRDFPYAQEAIRLGVCRYLLKPSKMDELHEALAREHPKRLPLKGEPWGGGDWRNSTIPQIWCGFSFCTIASLH